MAAWQQNSDGTWTWSKTADADPAMDKLWGHGAMIDPSQDPTGGPGHGAWIPGTKGLHWVWGADVDENLVRSYGRDHLTDPYHFPTDAHPETDINKPPPHDVPAPTLTDIWHGVAPDVTGGPPVTPNGDSQQQVTSPPVHGPFIVYPGAIRDAEQGVLTTIDQTIPHYDTLKAAVSDAPHQNVYQSGTQADLNNAQDRLLLRIGDSIELAGQYTQALNNAAQMYARADLDSFLPTMGAPTATPKPE